MNLEMLGRALEGATTGRLPEDRDTIENALVHLLAGVLHAWIDHHPEVGPAADRLIEIVLTNPNDPAIRALGIFERQAVRLGLAQLADVKAKAHAPKPEAP